MTEKETLLSFFDLSDAVLLCWLNDSNSSITYVSKSIEKLLGYTKGEIETQHLACSGCIHNDDNARVNYELNTAIEKNHSYLTHKPYRIITKDAHIKWISNHTVLVRDKDKNVISFIGYLTDVTELKNSELKLKYLSQIDQLTKINNRMYIDDILQKQYYHFHRNQEECSIILIDIDFFKSVNDNYGHIEGDSVLIEFAQLLKTSIREGDYLGRWGGEEFLIILPHTDIVRATILAHKLRHIIEEHRFSVVVHQTASFGVANFLKDMSIKELLVTADKALYKSKAKGRNCVTTKYEDIYKQ